MWRFGIGGGGFGGGAATTWVRYMSRKRAPNLRKINPKVPFQEAVSIAEGLYNIIKQNGPLTVPNTWNQVKDAGVSGLNSKTHMKIMLKWMRGKNMLKQFCNKVGSNKKFFLCTLPEDPQTDRTKSVPELNPKIEKTSMRRKKQAK